MTFAEIAEELGVDERSARRIVRVALAKLRAGLGESGPPELVARALVSAFEGRDFFSTATPGISIVPRRFSDIGTEDGRASRSARRNLSRSTMTGRRARHFGKDTMTTAKKLIAAFEQLELGAAWAEAHAAADRAVGAERESAAAKLFPLEIGPTSADAIATYGWLTERLTRAGYGEQMVDLHRRALTKNPPLAALFRSTEAIADVTAAGGVEAVGRYTRAIAEQLAAVTDHELAAAAVAFLAAEDSANRLVVAKTRHEEHARSELARLEDERRAAEREILDKTIERVRAAEAAAQDLRARATMAENEYRKLRSDALAARLRASGLSSLKIGTESGHWSVADLIGQVSRNEWSLEMIGRFEAALDAQERAA